MGGWKGGESPKEVSILFSYSQTYPNIMCIKSVPYLHQISANLAFNIFLMLLTKFVQNTVRALFFLIIMLNYATNWL